MLDEHVRVRRSGRSSRVPRPCEEFWREIDDAGGESVGTGGEIGRRQGFGHAVDPGQPVAEAFPGLDEEIEITPFVFERNDFRDGGDLFDKITVNRPAPLC